MNEQPSLSIPQTERTMAMLCHLLAIFVGFLAPLIIWLLQKDQMPFVDEHGKESLNFQISILIYGAISGILTFVVIGAFLAAAVIIFAIIEIIMASMAANEGKSFQYPFCIRLVK